MHVFTNIDVFYPDSGQRTSTINIVDVYYIESGRLLFRLWTSTTQKVGVYYLDCGRLLSRQQTSTIQIVDVYYLDSGRLLSRQWTSIICVGLLGYCRFFVLQFGNNVRKPYSQTIILWIIFYFSFLHCFLQRRSKKLSHFEIAFHKNQLQIYILDT